MPSCLGFYTDKNMIKYAKVNRDKNSGIYMLEAYGVKFYDNIMTTIDEIATEVGMDQCTVSLALTNEGYSSVNVFSSLKMKDRNDLIRSEFFAFCDREGMVPSTLEFRHRLVQYTGNPDQFIAICPYVTKSEFANLTTNFEGFKISTIAPLGFSIENLFVNKGIDEEAAIVNIEDKTTVTIMLRNEIQQVVEIPLGMNDVLDRLAEKYNSYSKAYEACKKVSVYIEDVISLDDESRDILDVVLPVFYDIRQRVETILTPYKKQIKALYLSGSAVIVNNVDLYFQENFPSLRCDIVRPFFVPKKDRSMKKEIVEVNSAIAIALNGLGLIDSSIDFSKSAKRNASPVPIKDRLKRMNPESIKESFKKFAEKTKSNLTFVDDGPKSVRHQTFFTRFKAYLAKKNKAKVNVAYDDDGNLQTEKIVRIDGFTAWLLRVSVTSITVLLIYFGVSSYITRALENNIAAADKTIAKAEAEVLKASGDIEYIRTRASEYSDKITKLTAVMEEIESEKIKSNFDIPNFMSQLMFIIPQEVAITNINISEFGEVEIDAVSTQYAQLGYFVSRLKLEEVLLNVDMTVVEMQQNIRIKVGGMLP